MKVKICGITNLEDALICQNAGADALGFIFYKSSKRYIEPGEVKKITSVLNPFVIKVGVFVNNTADEINLTCKLSGINMVQLHGDETHDICAKINLPIIKAIRIKDKFDIAEVTKWKDVVFLFDTYSNENYGGTGKQFDLELLPQKIYTKAIIAGGINCKNISSIMNKKYLPACIDLSSSVEIFPGKKDHKKIEEFFTIIKSKS
ncbi:MAG: phosphoribosylanthranilate isomerase [bacterium]